MNNCLRLVLVICVGFVLAISFSVGHEHSCSSSCSDFQFNSSPHFLQHDQNTHFQRHQCCVYSRPSICQRRLVNLFQHFSQPEKKPLYQFVDPKSDYGSRRHRRSGQNQQHKHRRTRYRKQNYDLNHGHQYDHAYRQNHDHAPVHNQRHRHEHGHGHGHGHKHSHNRICSRKQQHKNSQEHSSDGKHNCQMHNHSHGSRQSSWDFLAVPVLWASRKLKAALHPLHHFSIEKAALTASLLTSSVSLVSVLLFPFAKTLTTTLLPFAAGALLSDLVSHLLPHMYNGSTPPSPLALLLSVAFFALLDGFLQRATHAPHSNSDSDASHSHIHTLQGNETLPDSNMMEEIQTDTSSMAASSSAGNTCVTATNHSDCQSESHASSELNSSETYGLLKRTSSEPCVSAHDDLSDTVNESLRRNTPETRISVNPVSAFNERVVVAAYINLAADALHNFCDGLTLAAAFTASPTAGIATTIAIILHELPQELADFALLLRAGFHPLYALVANVLCAVTALAGTWLALRISYLLSDSTQTLVLPVATGALLYMTFASIIPDVVADLLAPVTNTSLHSSVLPQKVPLCQFVVRALIAFMSAAAGAAVVSLVEIAHEH